MKIVLSSRGSRGDIYPVIEIAAALRAKGHEVSLAIPELFADQARKYGLDPFLYTEDSRKVMKGIGSGLKATKNALNFFSNSINQQMEFMLDASKNADVLLTSVSEIAAPTVAEYRDITFYRLAFAPVLPGNQPPPLFPLQNMPSRLNRMAWTSLSVMAKLILKRFINKKRRKLGLKPVANPNKYFTGRSHALLAINPTLAPPCTTWQNKYRYSYTGYCYGSINGSLDRKLLDFIEGGPPPLYIGFGSVTIKKPEQFTDIVLKAARQTGKRIVLGEGWAGLSTNRYPENVFPVKATHHATLFSKMAGVIHHGGSGTIHTAAKSGVPQFVMPQIIDQYYWGNRIYKLGLGPKPVPPKKITANHLANMFEELSNGKYHTPAIELSKSMKLENGISEIVNIITNPD